MITLYQRGKVLPLLKGHKLIISELKNKFGAFQFYLILIVMIAVTVYLGFFWGNANYTQQQMTISTHEKSIYNLKLENEKLIKNLNILGVELEVAKLTQQQHFIEIGKSIDVEKDLRTQLAFYQQVMAPELNEQGFLIEGFNLEPALSDNSFRFELVLMQQNKTKNTLKGNLKVTLIGSENGKAKQYTLDSMLSDQEQKSLTFSFKYFQVIAGEISLPEGFQPEQVSVHADMFQFKRKKGELTTVFDWVINPY
ncbi:DUF6776 family protein [Paraglaciecola psychrophila]|uniref:Uncharacterized protein n=1 Tax=Paraglaciecola psychrophila 170 TaxID=1129794 RepID=K7AW28_9ALTE|nr:DUF6776 family protein [Paraglaciecola psychrophila]AGH47154.1 hypothetical protein C427_5055 [Paraglaciecola psychrophila 170]GAC39355.1 hypothetical protein GPSY_3744 [Paraglaciecola psychrophila 170]